MENSNENMLQGSITDKLWPMMIAHYKRTDSDNGTVITVKNDGPGEIKCNLFDMGKEKPWQEMVLSAGGTLKFNVRDYENGNTFKVETRHQEATVTIDNVKKER